ncbi:hypothetical protein U9R90_27725 [Streptomyces sp. E11-3]|uniref:hypothetical protein n=1 Tax=Streptomyces sp. E11-3 TaxID=3110112 RepID=UPI003980747B
MRVMLRATLDTQASNVAIENGTLPHLFESMFERLKPEAAYFTGNEGDRSCILIFDMQDSSQLPVVCEPFFVHLGAKVDVQPVMNREELQKGLAASQSGS